MKTLIRKYNIEGSLLCDKISWFLFGGVNCNPKG